MSPTGRSRADLSSARKILILRLRRVGDVVMTLPAVELLKSFLPDASLTYLIEEPYRRLVEGHPFVNQVLSVPEKQDRRGFFSFLRMVRRERFDVLLDFHGGPRASWITAFSGAACKVGYAIRSKGFLYDIRVPRRPEEGTLHSVQTHAALVRALGFDFNDGAIPPLRLPEATPDEKLRLDAMMGESGLAGGHFIVLHIGAGNAFRDWGAANHAETARRLIRRTGFPIALIGGSADLTRQAEVIAGAVASPDGIALDRIIGLAGRLNLIETKELMARAGLFIGPDSGPMHIAASTPTPIVAVFGPTLPAHFAPWRAGKRTVILQREMDCRPCKQRECLTHDFRCLKSITPADVESSCLPFLN